MNVIGRAPLISLILTSCCVACGSTPTPSEAGGTLRMLDRKPIAGRDSFLGIPIKTGQLVLGESPGDLSFFFNLAPGRFYRFTHAAILIIEDDGRPYVYDIAGELSVFKALYSSAPTGAISGSVTKTSFYDYCKPYYYVEVFDPPTDADPKKIAEFIKRCYDDQKPFDPYFNWNDKEAYFCTQMIAEALTYAGAKAPEFTPIKDNASLKTCLNWLEVPSDVTLPAGSFADPARYVGALSTFGSMTAVRAYFAAKAVIHERFTSEQKLGNVFLMDGLQLRLRPHVDAFVKEAIKAAQESAAGAEEELDEESVEAIVRGLADERLGHFERPAPPKSPGPPKAPGAPQEPESAPSKPEKG